MESMGDDFPAGTENEKKRGISKPHVIFFLIDNLGESKIKSTLMIICITKPCSLIVNRFVGKFDI